MIVSHTTAGIDNLVSFLVCLMPELFSLFTCLHSVYQLWSSLLVYVQNT